MTTYKREIKLHEDYPVTVLDAIKMGDGTNTTLKEFISNNIKSSMNKKTYQQTEFNFSSISDFITKNTSVTPTAEFKSNSTFGDKQYCGGICCNNKIYFCPNTADKIMVYDIKNDYIYYIGQGFGDFAFKYTGMVQYKGFLYCIPRGVNSLLQINPITDEVLEIPLKTKYPIQPYKDYRDSHHYNGCISDNGYLYLPPAYVSNKKMLKIDMDNFEHEELSFTCEHSTTWIGCCNLPNNKIVFLGNKGFRIWNCESDIIDTDIDYGSDTGIYDMVYDPRDDCLYGFGTNKLVKLDPIAKTATNLGSINYLDNGTYGTQLGADGKFYTITPSGSVIYEDKNNIKTTPDTIDTCNTSGMTVCSAGLVLTNDGSIYSVPGNGKLIKISFTGVSGRLPDYITTSKYYGKY